MRSPVLVLHRHNLSYILTDLLWERKAGVKQAKKGKKMSAGVSQIGGS